MIKRKRCQWIIKRSRDIPKKFWNELAFSQLNQFDASSQFLSIMKIYIKPGKKFPEILHRKTHECMYILSGTVIGLLDNKKVILSPGDFLYLPPQTSHAFQAVRKAVQALSIHIPKVDFKNPDVDIIESNSSKLRRSNNVKHI